MSKQTKKNKNAVNGKMRTCCLGAPSNTEVEERTSKALNEFRKYFVDTMVIEWQSQYLDLDSLVVTLQNVITEQGDREYEDLSDEDEEIGLLKNTAINRSTSLSFNPSNIFTLLTDEYDKLNTFFNQMETQMSERLTELERETERLKEITSTKELERDSEILHQAFIQLFKD